MRYKKNVITRMAEETLQRYPAGAAKVFFKAVCPRCGEDCVVSEPNTWHDHLDCCRCHQSFTVDLAGFMLLLDQKKLKAQTN